MLPGQKKENVFRRQVSIAISTLITSLLMIAINALLIGLLVMLLWNWIMPAVFPLFPASHHITYWQGWGLVYLLQIIGRGIKTS